MTFVLIGGFHVSYVDGFINFFLLISFDSCFNFNLIRRIYNRRLRREAGDGGELGIGGSMAVRGGQIGGG